MIREEWIHILIKRGFSAPGAKEIVADLRAVKSDLSNDDFDLWLKSLKAIEIPKILTKHHLSQKK